MAGAAALVEALAWPVVVLALLLLYRAPLAALLTSLARRGWKFSARGVSVEADALAPNAGLQAAAEALADAVAGGSGPVPLAEAARAAATADYLRLDLGTLATPRWLTSRLFLLAALVERNGAARAVVFTRGGWEFLGVATPGVVRRELGAAVPAFERALAAAWVQAATGAGEGFATRDGMTAEAMAKVVHAFLRPGPPGGAGGPAYLVALGPSPPDAAGWVRLPAGPPGTWERAATVPPDAAALRDLLPRALHTATLTASPGEALGGAQLRELARGTGPFLALVDPAGAFRGLLDRTAVLARAVGEATAEPG